MLIDKPSVALAAIIVGFVADSKSWTRPSSFCSICAVLVVGALLTVLRLRTGGDGWQSFLMRSHLSSVSSSLQPHFRRIDIEDLQYSTFHI